MNAKCILQVWPLGSMSSLGSCSTISLEEARVEIDWRTILSTFWNVVTNKAEFSCSNFNLLHVFGNVTVRAHFFFPFFFFTVHATL